MEFECKICGNKQGNRFYNVREMLFGTRDEFIYCDCSGCGCLQLVNPPEDLSKYYPDNYYSFQIYKRNFLRKKLNVYRDRYSFGINNFLGKIFYIKYGPPTYITWLNKIPISLESKILDIGCGTGKLLYRMGDTGFKNLMGVDAFIRKNIFYKNGVKIFKKDPFDVDGKFDLIMMHHSLEHMEDQHKIFDKISLLLSHGKYLLIRIPVSSTYPWKTYKENWFGIDAPRHFYLHSLKSIKFLADKYNFEITDTLFDSESNHLWASELYRNNIPLNDDRSYYVNKENSIFTKEQIDFFESETVRLNKIGDAGQAVIFMKKI